jgi:YesN/AraC family two-component response regulator
MRKILLNKSHLEGKFRLRIGFDYSALAEEGLDLVFKKKDSTDASVLRIKMIVEELERTLKRYPENLIKVELVGQMEQLMKSLCEKIGALETLAKIDDDSENNRIARKALHLIEDHCSISKFQQRAKEIFREVASNRASSTSHLGRGGWA